MDEFTFAIWRWAGETVMVLSAMGFVVLIGALIVFITLKMFNGMLKYINIELNQTKKKIVQVEYD